MAEKKIGDRTFATTPMLATEAIVLQARLAKVLGPALARLGEIFQGAGADKSEEAKARSNAAAIEAFTGIFANADPYELAQLIKDIVSKAEIKRTPTAPYHAIEFDSDFRGDSLKDLVPLVVWVLREQFGSFFSGLLASGGLGIKAGG